MEGLKLRLKGDWVDKILAYIARIMTSERLPYAYMEWTKKVQYPYIIGEYQEEENPNEDGMLQATVILTITGKDTWLELEKLKARIKRLFPPVEGGCDGEGVAIYYDNSFPIFTGTEEYKRLQINLTAKKWGKTSW